MWASLKRSDAVAGQRVTCAACDDFVGIVRGIRGESFEAEGRRHFYTVSGSGPLRASRCGPRFVVSPTFFHGVYRACRRWLMDHPYFPEDDFPAHVASQHLPPWVLVLIRDVDFSRSVGRDAAVTACAELLGVSRQQIYAQLA